RPEADTGTRLGDSPSRVAADVRGSGVSLDLAQIPSSAALTRSAGLGDSASWLRRHLWKVALATGLAVAVAYHTVPSPSNDAGYSAIVDLAGTVAVLVGIRLHRPARRLPWYLLAAYNALCLAGNAP